MDPIFRAAKQNRIFQDVVDQIQEAIINGRLKVGDKLPAERELKEMLKTSRSTLREALRVLEQKGLIEIKLGMGGGAIVTAVSSDQVTESLDLLIRSQKVSLNHLAEFRERVEGDVVALAAKRAGATELKKLTRLINEAKKYVDQGSDFVEEFLSADREVHFYFAVITENPIYISITKTIHGNIYRYFEKFLMPVMETPEMEENLQDLLDIAQAISEKEADKARRLAIKHVRRFNKYMKVVAQQKDNEIEF